jgi:hypothetical protein
MNFEAETEETALTPEQEIQLKQLALERAPSELAKWEAAKDEESKFSALPRAAFAAFHLERFALAEDLAKQSLSMACSFKENWNYGNAIHVGHTVLGLLALQSGKLSEAILSLKASGATPGSPQLNTFGPTMQLAKELLRTGEFEVVEQYLIQCRAFWEMGIIWLDLWEEKVRAHSIPNFIMRCYG